MDQRKDGLSLHKVGRYEIPAAKILKQLGFRHIPYSFSKEEEIGIFLSKERKKEWLQASEREDCEFKAVYFGEHFFSDV